MPRIITRKPKGIDAITILIAYEGHKDEKIYFERLAAAIPKQFHSIIRFIPIVREGHRSDLTGIYNDLLVYIEQKKIKLTKKYTAAYIVYDKDRNYESGNLKKTMQTIIECKKKGIENLVTAPSFELWLLLHYADIAAGKDEEKQLLIENKQISSKRYIKRFIASQGISPNTPDLFSKVSDAIENERMVNLSFHDKNITDAILFSSIGKIFEKINQEYKVPLSDYMVPI
jgi:hypothetical protein